MQRSLIIGLIVLVGLVGLWLGTRSTPPPPPAPVDAPEDVQAPEAIEPEEPEIEEPDPEPEPEPELEETPVEEGVIEEETPIDETPVDEAPAEEEAADPSALPESTPTMTEESALPDGDDPTQTVDDVVGDVTEEAPDMEAMTDPTATVEMPEDMTRDRLRDLVEDAEGLNSMQRNSLTMLLESAGDNRALLEEVYRSLIELTGE